MSVRSSGSRSSRSSRSSGGSSVRYRDGRLPDTAAVNALLYFTCRNPRKVKGVRVKQTTYDDNFDDRSVYSGWSGSSWGGSNIKTEIYLLETRGSYWGGYSDRQSSGGRTSRASGDAWDKPGRNKRSAHVEDDDSDSDSDDGSVAGGFPGPNGGPQMMGGGGGPPPPPMMRPPQGAFQAGFGPPPPPAGFPMGMPPHPGFPQRGPPMPMPGRATPMSMPRPTPPPGQFVRDPNGIQVFSG